MIKITVLTLFMLVSFSAVASDLFEVSPISTFAKEVSSDRNAIDKVDGSILLKEGEELYFWSLIAVNQDGVNFLEEHGFLEIKHDWRSSSVFCRLNSIPVGITQDKWKEIREVKLADYAENGWFTFRTKSSKKVFCYGDYTVSVKNGANRRANVFSKNKKFSININVGKKDE